MMIEEKIKKTIRDVPDFPKKGIVFKDVTPLFLDPALSKEIISYLANHLVQYRIDAIVAIESRGFIYGMPLSQALNVPFVPARKKGKLPGETVQVEYELEYGTAVLEMHKGVIKPGCNVLIHDDLLATGGTAAAAAELVKMQGANVSVFSFIVELSFLNGADVLKRYSENISSLARY